MSHKFECYRRVTSLPDLKGILPAVYEKLQDGRIWTAQAEATFLELMLPD